jgi:hypothetical protein
MLCEHTGFAALMELSASYHFFGMQTELPIKKGGKKQCNVGSHCSAGGAAYMVSFYQNGKTTLPNV